ncbi:MAG: PAS domain-containing protein [Pseudomonadota bacterium]
MTSSKTQAGFNPLEISFNNTADIIVFIGPDGALLEMNPQFEKITGRKIADVVGIPFPKTGLLSETAVTTIKKNLLALLDNQHAPAFEIELKTVKSGFQPFEVRGTRVLDTDGKIIAIHAVMRNIAKQKQYAQDILELKEFLNSVLNACPDPVFVKDRYHRWVILNDAFCQFIGKPFAELIGKSDYDIFPKEEAEVFWKMDNAVFETGKPNENVEKFTDAGGKTSLIRTRKSIFTNPMTGAMFLFGIIQKTTDPKPDREKLKQIGSALRRLVR